MSTLTFAEKIAQAENFLPINGTDYIEFYVGNAKQAAHYYKTAFGFQSVAYAGPETGVRDRASYVVQQGKIRLVLTSGLSSDSLLCEHQKKHGDGVKTATQEGQWHDHHHRHNLQALKAICPYSQHKSEQTECD